MKKLPIALLAFTLASPVFAQTPDPPAPETRPASPPRQRWFFGGGVGASFGDVNYVELAPLVGVNVAPRVGLALQPFYRWTDDKRYSPSVSTTDYGATLFTRVRIVAGFFAEADYQFTSYEYPVAGGTTRSTYNAFLAGGGYSIPVASQVGFYVSALYDFTYDGNDPNRPYDSPVRVQVGVAVGF
jgi:hypothetical protein